MLQDIQFYYPIETLEVGLHFNSGWLQALYAVLYLVLGQGKAGVCVRLCAKGDPRRAHMIALFMLLQICLLLHSL